MVVGRSIWGAKSKVAFGALALGAGAGAATIAKSNDPATALKLCTTVPIRLFRHHFHDCIR
ncbi:hypothetical protein HanRHA438_Chr12g0553691 [Helianthus annuus]|uniref:Uncharacterized protein n=1 Tax=Helianthus annuus TaxID=4232 RepID=A0A9K3HGN5_HELAN|nr:hypothetical protein HanXRQr2_Chr12g0542561 [Helianthus annuus]KAJ0862787.1 hypothetical protein HanPSC8_Chr12g0522361 [Helianthus annuus]KAJ0866604.1 hypothetical protein HanRHA438_Chr12g0553691 [Helianthus annuus]